MRSDVSVMLDPYVLDVLLPDLVGHDQRASSFLVYLALWRRWSRKAGEGVRISHQQLAYATGLSRSTVQEALEHLARRQLIQTKRASATAVPVHLVLRPWMRGRGE